MDIIILLNNIKICINNEITDYLEGSKIMDSFNDEDITGFKIDDILINTEGISIKFRNGDVSGCLGKGW